MNTPDKQQVFSINNSTDFDQVALQIFQHQAKNCSVYRQFIRGLRIDADKIISVEQIPFLPIEFFKSHRILSTDAPVELTFTSSGTTGMITSSHLVSDKTWYEDSFRRAFQLFYGDIRDYTVLALLPSYLEREGSSLIYMVDDLIKQSENPDSGFFLYNHDELYQQLKKQQEAKKPTLLIGVTFGLLDFIETYQINFPELIVMETGGMKGRRKEMIREELHDTLCKGFGVSHIHSEYGMTELLSQAYSKGDGIFECPPWMKIIIRDTNDPISTLAKGKTGGINVIDLANINSCSFIATQDLGKINADGAFEVLGRFDQSDIRGCNLLIA
ncbi:LuxE/PaaK family acyltransferase [Mucilaginibacter lappiensis]|uniref:Phenylacetate-coenzyme A ligase PaaK-like adenylate-forming protein n=1 Tax=Mucilaginibacter lappiensis TaxID=354630 RepID=A0A1N7AN69_9SPHI|nr:acyl transferase [Mucilaginibacter lappiensis]MBB6110531.1 phenylacetate-coenzyme A ligase PaaK-like adenylate-forming protein [Mucilaginibacter lappiensis]MBB6131377.1 phenylacetate-coenzyme A ligase PaaK-like adenylate-forming protein [Mucilaginibacter lappiensis]SIR40421.1 Acyl-protein synthetase, LuxE [Mucilaginibacter lappiensis]